MASYAAGGHLIAMNVIKYEFHYGRIMHAGLTTFTNNVKVASKFQFGRGGGGGVRN